MSFSKESVEAGGTASRDAFIGFAPPLLGAQPQRLPVLRCEAGLLALESPGGLAADADPLNPAAAPLLAHALREQVRAGKPELTRLGVQTVHSVFNLEPEMSGVALYAVSRDAVDFWRNAYGSRLLRFHFLLICEPAPSLADEIVCELPIARHRDGSRMLVSHKSGKKTQTRFRRLLATGATLAGSNSVTALAPAAGSCTDGGALSASGLELWEAQTDYLRPHQLRLHAFEVGLRICGEAFYGEVPPLYLSDVRGKRRRLAGEAPLWAQPAIHLAQIEASAEAAAAEFAHLFPLRAAWPRPLALACKHTFGENFEDFYKNWRND